MEIREQLSQARQRAQARVESYRDAVAATARRAAEQAANGVSAARGPICVVADAGRRVNDISHRYFAQLVKQQLHTLEGVIEDGSERLSRAAEARDFRALVVEQRKLYPASRERLGRDLKVTWELAASTGRELRTVASETYAELAHGARVTPKAPRRRTKRARARKASKAA
ncbi:MAG TPA: phasin family protein [Steroidobacteraceae bacterium]|nr:phasin family protein [Steroidobacteraceae bacterium]